MLECISLTCHAAEWEVAVTSRSRSSPILMGWWSAQCNDFTKVIDDKEPGPSWRKQLLGERPRETAET